MELGKVKEIKDRGAKNGDDIVMDFTGKIDGNNAVFQRYAENILKRKVLLVYVVEQADNRQAMVLLEEVYVTTHIILMVRCHVAYLRLIDIGILEAEFCGRAVDVGLIAIASIHLTKDSLTHI